MGIENKSIVLVLNKLYQRIGWMTVKQAIITLNSTNDQITPAAKALQIEYVLNDDGTPNFEKVEFMQERTWEEWICDVKVRDWDLVIHSPHLSIRIPHIIITVNYAKMPIKKQRICKETIKKRDNNRCQYTNELLTNKTFSLDHLNPTSKGGKNVFSNVVAAHIDVNRKKGNKTLEEFGMPLLRLPKSPLPIPICHLINEARHPDHNLFMTK